MTDTFIELSEDAFDAQYELRTNHINPNASWAHGDSAGCLFETYGEEIAFVRRQNPRTVWTLTDSDDGDQYLLSGFHLVNRVGYLISTVPVPEGTTIQVRIPMQSKEPAEATAGTLAPAAVNACEGISTQALERGAVGELRHCLGMILDAAGDLDAAIDGVTDEFDDERDRLNAAIRATQATLDAGMEIDVHELLAGRKQIAPIWCIEDVQGSRPDLTAEQAWEVLEEVGRKHDAEYGINWTTLEIMADILFPEKVESHTREEE